PARIRELRRLAADQTAPAEPRDEVDAAAVPERRRTDLRRALQRFVLVVARVDDAGIRIEERQVGQRRALARRRAHEDAARRVAATGQLVLDRAVRRLEERRGVDRVVDREAVVGDERPRLQHVVEAGHRALLDALPLTLTRVLAGDAERRRELVVDTHDRLLRQVLVDRPTRLEVVAVRRHLLLRRQRVHVEDRQTGRVEFLGRDDVVRVRLARDRALQLRNGPADVVERLREVALTLERGRHTQPVELTTRLGRPVLVAVEEEQLVVTAGTAHRTAERVTPRAALGDLLVNAVLLVLPAVRVPVRVVLDVVERAVELVRAALGHGRDLQTRRPAELSLITRGQHLNL